MHKTMLGRLTVVAFEAWMPAWLLHLLHVKIWVLSLEYGKQVGHKLPVLGPFSTPALVCMHLSCRAATYLAPLELPENSQ